MEHFFPGFKWTPTLRCTPESNYWGDADVDHTQTIGADTVKLLGGYILRIPPGFRHPCLRYRNTRIIWLILTFFFFCI